MPTATACSARSTTPRTRSRTRCCAPGAAWRASRASSLRSWLYTIATNTCLNLIGRRPKRVLPIDYAPAADPHGGARRAGGRDGLDGALRRRRLGLEDGLAASEARYEQRESVELAFVAALQHLPANQRAVLILRDVLGFSAKEIAAVLETTVASVNSALQRARATVEERLPSRASRPRCAPWATSDCNEIVESYMQAWEACDVDAVVGMLTEDACFSMPRWPRGSGRGTRSRPSSSARRCRGSGAGSRCGCAQTGRRRSASTAGTPRRRATSRSPRRADLPRRGHQRRDGVHHPYPPETDDREVILRLPEQPGEPAQPAGGVRELRPARSSGLSGRAGRPAPCSATSSSSRALCHSASVRGLRRACP